MIIYLIYTYLYNVFTENETFSTVKDKLSKLQSLLEPLDVLCCNDIILPKTSLQWKETEEVLKKCSKVLEDIIDLIGPKGNVYCTVNDELKNFTETYSEVENIQKRYDLFPRNPFYSYLISL